MDSPRRKRVAVLGSTGSIGTSTLEVIASHPDRLQLIGLAAHARLELLEPQIARHRPPFVAVVDEEQAQALRQRTHGMCAVLGGVDGLTELATHPDVDMVVVGTAGREALLPLIRAIEAGKQIALASKELLVMAGELIMQLVREHGVSLIPVDSEHAAVFQLMQGVARHEIERFVITGSGGPLWSLSAAEMVSAGRETVLRHPKWRMGPKITVDSATLMNKGLEIIEAHWLFGMPWERLRVLIHPQAQVHAFLELVDGTILAQMSACDMRVPIQYALSFPERWPTRLPRLAPGSLSGAQFFEPDLTRFPCFRLALEAALGGGSACAVLSAANDVAVKAYLQDALPFPEIPRLIEETLAQHASIAHPTLEQVLASDDWARQTARELVDRVSSHAQPSAVR